MSALSMVWAAQAPAGWEVKMLQKDTGFAMLLNAASWDWRVQLLTRPAALDRTDVINH